MVPRTDNSPKRPALEQCPVLQEKARFLDALTAWFREHGRDLPWRRTRSPYAVLVSELMLQQTTVAAVLGYYERFLRRFPTVESLAAADEQDVLAAWAGLGYYRRARLLQAAAREVVSRHDGLFPSDLKTLQTLPGLGRYTAGAVGSFAFDFPAPVVEANTARLYARLFAIEGVLTEASVQRSLWEAAEVLLPESGGCEHNSALMDLGSLVCTPVSPRCEECPAAAWCLARQLGKTGSIPAPAVRREKVGRTFAGGVLSSGKRYLVRQIPTGEWHAGMYEFPKIAVAEGTSLAAMPRELVGALRHRCRADELEHFARLRYTVTHHAVTLEVWRGRCEPVADSREWEENHLLPGVFHWMTLAEIAQLPLGSAQRRLLRLLADPDDLFGSATPI